MAEVIPVNNEHQKCYNKWIASTITAYTRITMYQAILDCGIDNFLYCDTDGLYVLNYQNQLYEHPFELGAWKREKEFDKFLVMGAKVYYIKKDDKLISAKFAGVNQKWLKDNFDSSIYKTNDMALENAKLKPVRLESGIIIEPVSVKINKRTI